MEHIATIQFTDAESGAEAYAFVRASTAPEGPITLALSLESDGDIEVVMPLADCERLIAALRQAVSESGATH